MNSRTFTVGALVLALVGAAGLLVLQRLEIKRLTAEIAELRTQPDEVAWLQETNRQLAERLEAVVGASQANQSELLRLRGEGSRLRQLQQENAQLQAQRQELQRRWEAAQAAASASPAQVQVTQATHSPAPEDTDLGVVELADGVPVRFDLGGGTNCVVMLKALSDGNVTLSLETEMAGADGTPSRLAMSQLTAHPGQYCAVSVGGRMIALGAKLKTP